MCQRPSSRGTARQLAAVFQHEQQRVEQCPVVGAHVATLARQAVCDASGLLPSEFHPASLSENANTPNSANRPQAEDVLGEMFVAGVDAPGVARTRAAREKFAQRVVSLDSVLL